MHLKHCFHHFHAPLPQKLFIYRTSTHHISPSNINHCTSCSSQPLNYNNATSSHAVITDHTTLPPSNIEAAKQLTKDIMQCNTFDDVLHLLESHSNISTLRHKSAALNRLRQLNLAHNKRPHDSSALQYPLLLDQIVDDILESDSSEWSAPTISSLLLAYGTLLTPHRPDLLDRIELEMLRDDVACCPSWTLVVILKALIPLKHTSTAKKILQRVEDNFLLRNSTNQSKEELCFPPPTSPPQRPPTLLRDLRLHHFKQQGKLGDLAWALAGLGCSSDIVHAILLQCMNDDTTFSTSMIGHALRRDLSRTESHKKAQRDAAAVVPPPPPLEIARVCMAVVTRGRRHSAELAMDYAADVMEALVRHPQFYFYSTDGYNNTNTGTLQTPADHNYYNGAGSNKYSSRQRRDSKSKGAAITSHLPHKQWRVEQNQHHPLRDAIVLLSAYSKLAVRVAVPSLRAIPNCSNCIGSSTTKHGNNDVNQQDNGQRVKHIHRTKQDELDGDGLDGGMDITRVTSRWTCSIIDMFKKHPNRSKAAFVLFKAIQPHVSTLPTEDIPPVLYSLARLQRQPPAEMLRSLEERTVKMAPNMTSKGMSIVCWSLAMMRHYSGSILQIVAETMYTKYLTQVSSPGRRSDSLPAQACCMLLYAYASLSVPLPDGHEQRLSGVVQDNATAFCAGSDSRMVDQSTKATIPQFLTALASYTETILDEILPFLLPTLGWSAVILFDVESIEKKENLQNRKKEHIPSHRQQQSYAMCSLLASWRRAIVKSNHVLPSYALSTLYNVELALRIEAPNLVALCSTRQRNTAEPSFDNEYNAFFDALYSAGRLQGHARKEWSTQVLEITSSTGAVQKESENTTGDGDAPLQRPHRAVSMLQQQVFDAVLSSTESALPWVPEYWDSSIDYPIDIAVVLTIPMNMQAADVQTGNAILNSTSFEQIKIAIEVDGPLHFTTNTYQLVGQTVLKRRLLKKLGWHVVSIPYFEWEKVKKNSNPASRTKPSTKGGSRAASAFIRQSILSQCGIDIQKLAQRYSRMINEQTQEVVVDSHDLDKDDDRSSSGHQVDRDEVNEVHQRATRLDMLKVRKGKLSKASLVSKHALRRTATTLRQQDEE